MAAFVLVASLGTAAAIAEDGARSTGDVVAVGKLDRIPDDARAVFGDDIVPNGYFAPIGSPTHSDAPNVSVTGTLLMIPEARQLWQFFVTTHNGQKTSVVVRNLDSLQIVHSFVITGLLQRGGISDFGGEWMHAVDGDDRLFLVHQTTKGIISFDLHTFQRRDYAVPINLLVQPLGGMSYDRFANRLLLAYAVAGSTSAANPFTVLYGLNLADGAISPPRPVRSCNAPLPSTESNSTYQVAPYIKNNQNVYVPCQRSGMSGAVVRVPYDDILNPASTEDVVVGPTNLETVLVDEGSGRMFMMTVRGEIWAFDTATMAFVGVVGANADNSRSDAMGYGIDPASGRLFFLSPTYGLGSVEGRFFPIPQAKTERQLQNHAQERILSDPATNRVFVIEGRGVNKGFSYTIYKFPPAPVPPPAPDPDLNTVDEAEVKDVTEGRYFGSASGYGTRILLANGVIPIVPAPALGELAPTAQVFFENVTPGCAFTDRELAIGRVAKAEADTGSTAAEAIAVELDDRSRLDLDRPSRCDVTIRDHNRNNVFRGLFTVAPVNLANTSDSPRWNHEPAVCSSSEGEQAKTDTGDDHGVPLGSSTVTCPVPGGDVVAVAEGGISGAISVGKAVASTKISRDDGGLHSYAEAIASDITIGSDDLIHIAEVRSIGRSTSNGRPRREGTMSTHTVSIKGLRVLGETVCQVCDVQQALDAMNRVVAGRAQFRVGLSGADERLVKGSPKGALTAVQKSPERQVSDQSLVGDFTTEVPGLELIVYNDNSKWGRARQLYQFAGVSTSATYNIVRVPSGGGLVFEDGTPESVADIVEVLEASEAERIATETVSMESEEGGGGILGAVRRAIKAVARGIRLFATEPRQGLLLLTGWTLFALPIVLFRRRLALRETT